LVERCFRNAFFGFLSVCGVWFYGLVVVVWSGFDFMRKVWTYRRKGRKGVYVAWYENGRQRCKALPNKTLADHFAKIKYQQLNSDVFLSTINMGWNDACSEFLVRYERMGLARSTKKQAEMFLKRFTAICRPTGTKSITQRMIDRYFIQRQRQNISDFTVNKDVERAKTLMVWLQKNQYHPGGLDITKLKTASPKTRAMTDEQIARLVAAAPHIEWKIRIVLGLSTGLRKTDLYNIQLSDVDLDSRWVNLVQKKTGKEYSGPVPDDLIGPLKMYLAGRTDHMNQKPDANKNLFRVTAAGWLDKEFRKFRPGNETIQSLRKTYSTRIESTSISTEMLGHASKSVARTFYNDMDYIKWIRVNQLPIKKWLDF